MSITKQFMWVVMISLSAFSAQAGEIALTQTQQKSMGIDVAQVELAVGGQGKRFSAEGHAAPCARAVD